MAHKISGLEEEIRYIDVPVIVCDMCEHVHPISNLPVTDSDGEGLSKATCKNCDEDLFRLGFSDEPRKLADVRHHISDTESFICHWKEEIDNVMTDEKVKVMCEQMEMKRKQLQELDLGPLHE